MTDRSAQVARYILKADTSTQKSRDLVFGLVKAFYGVPAEEVMRGVEIALELEESEIWAKQVAKNGEVIDLPAFLQRGDAA